MCSSSLLLVDRQLGFQCGATTNSAAMDILLLVLIVTNSVTLGKLLTLSVPQFPHL